MVAEPALLLWLRDHLLLLAVLSAAIVWAGLTLPNQPVSAQIVLGTAILSALVVERLAIPGDRVVRIESATFALVVVAAGLLGNGAGAILVGIAGLSAAARFRPDSVRLAAGMQAALLMALAVTGAVFIQVHSLAPPTLFLWAGILGFAGYDQLRQRAFRQVAFFALAIVWISLLLASVYGGSALPVQFHQPLMVAHHTLRFGLGFMTADMLIVSGIALHASGWKGLRFWRRELVPTFARYNALAVAGALIVVGFDRYGLPGGIAGLGILLAYVAVRYEWAKSRQRLVATICALTSALDARDPYTKSHSDRVAAYAVGIATQLGWSRRRCRDLEIAAHLHDVGKIGIRDEVLLKPGRLTDTEFAAIQGHSQLSASIVRNIPDFHRITSIIRQHHERLDGSGYPDAIREKDLLPEARILAVADVYDALTSNRSYRSAMSHPDALAIIRDEEGSRLDAEAVAALVELDQQDHIEGTLQFSYCLTH